MAMPIRKVNNPTPTPTPETRGGGWRGWLSITALVFLVGFFVATADQLGLFHRFDLRGYDYLVKLQGPVPASDNALLVDFDEESVKAYKVFRIPRQLLADVIAKTSAGKPSVIGLDVLLDEAREPDKDEHLAKVIDEAGNVLLISEYAFGDKKRRSEPLPMFRDAAAGVTFADILSDSDGSTRRMFLAVTSPDYNGLSFPVGMAMISKSWKPPVPNGKGYVRFGPHEIPLASAEPATSWIHFHWSPPVHRIPIQKLLSTDFDTSIFRDKIVIIGETSERGKDHFNTPVSAARELRDQGRETLYGSEIHAASVETLLTGDALRTMHAVPRWLLGIFLAFLVAGCGYLHRWFVSVAACVLMVFAVFGVSYYLYTHKLLWMPFTATEACLVLALPAGLGYRSVEERRLKRLMEAERCQIMGLFERYVSPDVAAEIWKRRDQIVLAGEERVATILFSDIRSFTAMTCNVRSKDVLAWLNRYLTAMGDVIKKNGGFLNKFIGDGIMVVFGAPLSEGPQDDACRAVQCALDMIARLDEWNAALKPGGNSLDDHPMKIGIGIHTGPVTAGNVGSTDRLEYSVIGEAVNLASRLESLTKDFGTPIVISSDTWKLIHGQFSTVSLGEKQVRGITNPIPLYSVEAHSAVEVHS